VCYANEWNCVSLPPEEFARLNRRLNDMLTEGGRSSESVRRSMMTGCVFGKDDATLSQKITAHGRTLEQLQQHGTVAGSPSAVKEQLAAFEEAGLKRIMLQRLDLDDLESMEALARTVL
jgi:alkanesulfonate monooxygenase SsuD/methylene tetrahydromethanopterin reductase-like flavin-dependent oxidoreductase (luciferase family)